MMAESGPEKRGYYGRVGAGRPSKRMTNELRPLQAWLRAMDRMQRKYVQT
jgi:hypothetical protein